MVKSSWLKEKLASMRSGMRWGLETGSVSYEDPTGDGVETMPKGWPVPVGGRGLLRAGVGGGGGCQLIQSEKQNQEEIHIKRFIAKRV